MTFRACLIAATLILPPTLSTAQPAAQAVPRLLGSAPTASCQTWLQERQQNAAYKRTKDATKNADPSLLGFFMENWVLGLVSGAALPQQDDAQGPLNDPAANVDEDDVLTRTDVYCRGHSSDPLGSAALHVVADLLRDQADRVRAALRRHCSTAPNDPRCQGNRANQ